MTLTTVARGYFVISLFHHLPTCCTLNKRFVHVQTTVLLYTIILLELTIVDLCAHSDTQQCAAGPFVQASTFACMLTADCTRWSSHLPEHFYNSTRERSQTRGHRLGHRFGTIAPTPETVTSPRVQPSLPSSICIVLRVVFCGPYICRTVPLCYPTQKDCCAHVQLAIVEKLL